MTVKDHPAPPTDGVIKSLGHLVQKAEGGDAGKPVFRITSEVLDRHMDRVKAGSLKTEGFDKNPVLLWNHNDCVPAIGTCRVFQEGDEWFMEPAFDGIGDLSKDVAAKVAAGTLRTCSIRFRYLKYAYNEEGGLDYEEVELLEVSITNIPANPEALRVKNKTPTQSKNAETPPEGEQPQDKESINAAVAEALKPLIEAVARLEAKVAKLSGEEPAEEAPSEEKNDAPAEEPPAEEKDEPPPEEKKSVGGERRPFLFIA